MEDSAKIMGRIEQIKRALDRRKNEIDAARKGSIEIHFAGESLAIKVSVIDEIKNRVTS